MTIVKSTCTHCKREVELSTRDIDLQVCCNDPLLSFYTYDCPQCHEFVKREATDFVVSLLISGGIRPIVWAVPAEALEAKTGPALTLDDVLDFALALGTTDLLSAAAQTETSA